MTVQLTIEEKKRLYCTLDTLLDEKENVPLAAIGVLLHRNGLTPQRYGYGKLKPFLQELGTNREGGFLTFAEWEVNGGPQTFATFHRNPAWDEAGAGARWTDEPQEGVLPPRDPAAGTVGRSFGETACTPHAADPAEADAPFGDGAEYATQPAEPATATAPAGSAAAAPAEPVAAATGPAAAANAPGAVRPAEPAPARGPLAELAARLAAQCAAQPDYASAPAPAEILTTTAPVLTDFCYVPHARQEQVRAAAPGYHPLEVVCVGWQAARAAGAVRVYEGKLVFPLPALRADGKTPLEASLKPQMESGSNLLPWFLSYINDFVKPDGAKTAPSKAIERFAWLGNWDAFLEKLADVALDEQWDFEAGRPDENGHSRAILKSYLCTTFYRLQKEGKVAIAPDGTLAAFNTGLVNDRYDDIFCCFEPFAGPIPWEFAGFATAGARGLGKRLVSLFNPLPETASYFDRKEDMLFDLDKELITDYDHVILDNMERLPMEFLEEEMRGSAEATEVLAELRGERDRTRRRALFAELSEIVDGDARLFRRLRSGLEDAVDTARRRVRWNYKTAIPSYYPRGNTMSLLLPLSLLRDNEADAALVVQLMPSGNYQGQTILTMRQAYQNARLICRPDSDWLTPARADAAEPDDPEPEAAEQRADGENAEGETEAQEERAW